MPLNPNDPGSQPQDPSSQTGSNFGAEYLANIQRASAFLATSMSQMDKTMGKLSGILSDVSKKHYAEMRKQEDLFTKFVYTKERQALNSLIEDRKKAIRSLGIEEARKINAIKNLGKGSDEEKRAQMDEVRAEYAQKRVMLEKSAGKAIRDAGKVADEVDTKRTTSLKDFINGVRGPLNKSLLDTNSLWEAAIVAMVTASSRLSTISKASAALRTAGLSGTAPVGIPPAGGGTMGGFVGGDVGNMIKAFGTLSARLPGITNHIDEFIGILSTAPRALKEVQQDGGKSMTEFVASMGYVGIGAKESLELMASASNNWNMSSRDLTRTFTKSMSITKATNMNFKEVFDSLLRLTGSLRGLTFNASAAGGVLDSVVFPLTKLKFSNKEIETFSQNIGDFLGHLSVSKLAGIVEFTKGGGLPSRTTLTSAADSPMRTLVGFLKPVFGQFAKGSTERLLAVQSVAGQMGLAGADTLKGATALESIIDNFKEGSKAGEKAMREFQKANAPKDIQAEGLKTLSNAAGTLAHIEDLLMATVKQWSEPLMLMMSGMNNSIIPGAKVILSPAGAIGSYEDKFESIARKHRDAFMVATKVGHQLRQIGALPFIPPSR